VDLKEWKREGGFTISTNKELLDLDVIFQFLSQSYWAAGLSKKVLTQSIQHSPICYGIYDRNSSQAGFARIITDFTRFAWLSDVFVLPEYRGKGLSKWLMEVITTDPQFEGVSFQLATKDAHGLYKQFGFTELKSPEMRLERSINLGLIQKNHA
jgi:GNAT superfamily N-acetyltransferase